MGKNNKIRWYEWPAGLVVLAVYAAIRAYGMWDQRMRDKGL